MKVFLIIWIAVLLVPWGLRAQSETRSREELDYNYDRYRQTFEAELNDAATPGMEENAANSFRYSAVPEWLLQPLSYSSSTLLVIGISDPGIDSAIARPQAIFRALFLASLMNNTIVSNLVDNYSEDIEDKSSQISGQYVDYFEFTSQVNFTVEDAFIIKEAFTDFGECIVMIEVPAFSDSRPVLSFNTVGMITEFDKNGVYECNSRIEFSGQSQANSLDDNYKYISRSVNNLAEVESYYQDYLLSTSIGKLKYSEHDSIPGSQQLLAGVKTDRGLWNAYLTAVIKIVTLELRTLPAQIKSSSDNYTGKTQILNREAMTGNLTFRLNQIFLNDNKLWAILDQFKFSQL